MFTRTRRLACSFCGRKAADVAKLVAGPITYLRPRAYICDACIAMARRIMEDADTNPPKVTRLDQPRTE